jgi:hypothetical protein
MVTSTGESEDLISLIQALLVALLTLRPRKWGRYVPSKRLLTFIRLHGIIFQKVELLITTAVRTSNPAQNQVTFNDTTSTVFCTQYGRVPTFWGNLLPPSSDAEVMVASEMRR